MKEHLPSVILATFLKLNINWKKKNSGVFNFANNEINVIQWAQNFAIFFISYLGVSRPTFGYDWGDSLTHLILITAFVKFRREGHRELRNEVGFVSPIKYLVGFKLGAFRFL